MAQMEAAELQHLDAAPVPPPAGTGAVQVAAMPNPGCLVYPPALATHEEVVADISLFFNALIKLLNFMGLPLKIPKIANQEIDVHRLYIEVTKRGGLELVIAKKLFVSVCEPFNFPASFTNKSFVVRKLYCNVLHHFEQVYYFRQSGRPLVPVPVSEQQQQHRSRGGNGSSPLRRGNTSRPRSHPSGRHPSTPRAPLGALPSAPLRGDFRHAVGYLAASGASPMHSPSGKRKQGADSSMAPAATNLLTKPAGNLGPGSLGSKLAPAPLVVPPLLPSLPLGFKPLIRATNLKPHASLPTQLVPASGCGLGLGAHHELSNAGADSGELQGRPPTTSPTTSCTSGTPQMAPPVLAPPGLEAGLEFPCRIMAVYDNYYIISMHVPGTVPMLGQLMKCIPPNMSLAPGVLPHQLIYQPCRSTARNTATDTTTGGGAHMQHSKASAFMQHIMGGGGTSGAGDGSGTSAAEREDELLSLGTVLPPDTCLLGFEQLAREWEHCSGGKDGKDDGADAAADVVAQYSPADHQECAKKLRLRSNGGYAVMGEHCWPPNNASTTAATTVPTTFGGAGGAGAVRPGGAAPHPPRSAFTCFMVYLNMMGSERLGGRPLQEVAAEMWEVMTVEQKAPYQEVARRDHERYMQDTMGFGQKLPEPGQLGGGAAGAAAASPEDDDDDNLVAALAGQRHAADALAAGAAAKASAGDDPAGPHVSTMLSSHDGATSEATETGGQPVGSGFMDVGASPNGQIVGRASGSLTGTAVGGGTAVSGLPAGTGTSQSAFPASTAGMASQLPSAAGALTSMAGAGPGAYPYPMHGGFEPGSDPLYHERTSGIGSRDASRPATAAAALPAGAAGMGEEALSMDGAPKLPGCHSLPLGMITSRTGKSSRSQDTLLLPMHGMPPGVDAMFNPNPNPARASKKGSGMRSLSHSYAPVMPHYPAMVSGPYGSMGPMFGAYPQPDGGGYDGEVSLDPSDLAAGYGGRGHPGMLGAGMPMQQRALHASYDSFHPGMGFGAERDPATSKTLHYTRMQQAAQQQSRALLKQQQQQLQAAQQQQQQFLGVGGPMPMPGMVDFMHHMPPTHMGHLGGPMAPKPMEDSGLAWSGRESARAGAAKGVLTNDAMVRAAAMAARGGMRLARPPPLGARSGDNGDDGDEDPMIHMPPQLAVNTQELFCRMDISGGGAAPLSARMGGGPGAASSLDGLPLPLPGMEAGDGRCGVGNLPPGMTGTTPLTSPSGGRFLGDIADDLSSADDLLAQLGEDDYDHMGHMGGMLEHMDASHMGHMGPPGAGHPHGMPCMGDGRASSAGVSMSLGPLGASNGMAPGLMPGQPQGPVPGSADPQPGAAAETAARAAAAQVVAFAAAAGGEAGPALALKQEQQLQQGAKQALAVGEAMLATPTLPT